MRKYPTSCTPLEGIFYPSVGSWSRLQFAYTLFYEKHLEALILRETFPRITQIWKTRNLSSFPHVGLKEENHFKHVFGEGFEKKFILDIQDAMLVKIYLFVQNILPFIFTTIFDDKNFSRHLGSAPPVVVSNTWFISGCCQGDTEEHFFCP